MKSSICLSASMETLMALYLRILLGVQKEVIAQSAKVSGAVTLNAGMKN